MQAKASFEMSILLLQTYAITIINKANVAIKTYQLKLNSLHYANMFTTILQTSSPQSLNTARDTPADAVPEPYMSRFWGLLCTRPPYR